MTEEEKVVKPYGFPPVEGSYTLTGSQEGVSYYGTALDLESQIQFKHYFRVDESIVDVNDLEIKCSYPTALKKNGSFYEITISGIPAHKLTENHLEVSFGGISLDYPMIAYGAKALETGNKELYTLMFALAHYANEAFDYSVKES